LIEQKKERRKREAEISERFGYLLTYTDPLKTKQKEREREREREKSFWKKSFQKVPMS
jgi:hypothetical protein